MKKFLEIEETNFGTHKMIIETLSRMGVKIDHRKLDQICFILLGKNNTYLAHYLEIKEFLGEKVTITPEDLSIRNTIALLLENWEKIKIKDEESMLLYGTVPSIEIVSYKAKKNWELIRNITIEDIKKAQEML